MLGKGLLPRGVPEPGTGTGTGTLLRSGFGLLGALPRRLRGADHVKPD